jgi:hypothetical protein
MNTPNRDNVDGLHKRENATVAMIADIDAKLDRLTEARAERAEALRNIRAALARSLLSGQDGAALSRER